jgi:hypothetical protein
MAKTGLTTSTTSKTADMRTREAIAIEDLTKRYGHYFSLGLNDISRLKALLPLAGARLSCYPGLRRCQPPRVPACFRWMRSWLRFSWSNTLGDAMWEIPDRLEVDLFLDVVDDSACAPPDTPVRRTDDGLVLLWTATHLRHLSKLAAWRLRRLGLRLAGDS